MRGGGSKVAQGTLVQATVCKEVDQARANLKTIVHSIWEQLKTNSTQCRTTRMKNSVKGYRMSALKVRGQYPVAQNEFPK